MAGITKYLPFLSTCVINFLSAPILKRINKTDDNSYFILFNK